MRSPRRFRTTLSRVMAVNAAFAVLFAACRLGLAGLAEYAPLFGSAWACFLLLVVLNEFLDVLLGTRCPECRKKALRRLALPLSLVSYYACSACGARFKRTSPFTPWQDASGPKDLEFSRRKSSTRRWLGYSVPEADDSTCGTLLRSKRSRAGSRRRDDAGEPAVTNRPPP